MARTEIMVDRTTYVLQAMTDKRGGEYITRVAPYDETEYHWALARTPGVWTICRSGKSIAQIVSDDPEAVAMECKLRDKALKLRRTGGIW